MPSPSLSRDGATAGASIPAPFFRIADALGALACAGRLTPCEGVSHSEAVETSMISPDIRQKLRAAALDKNDRTRADDEAMLDIISRRERGETWPAIAMIHGLKVDSLRANVRRLWLDYAESEAA